jgi:biopolymer transport protein ExbD
VDSITLVNACLLLFMFHLAASPYVSQTAERFSIQLPPPGTHQVPYSAKILTLTPGGLAFLNDQPVEIARLAQALRGFGQAHPGVPLLIEADEAVSHAVLMSIVRQARAAGIKEIALASRLPAPPPPDEPLPK